MRLTTLENFGGIDADEDILLRECFQDHPAYLSAKDHERWLVIGRKGSGKTAAFKRLITERAPEHFSYGHTFDDYPWPHHDLQAQVGVPEERRYVHSWRYLILLSPRQDLCSIKISLSPGAKKPKTHSPASKASSWTLTVRATPT